MRPNITIAYRNATSSIAYTDANKSIARSETLEEAYEENTRLSERLKMKISNTLYERLQTLSKRFKGYISKQVFNTMSETRNDRWLRNLFHLTVHHWWDLLKRTAQINMIQVPTACHLGHCLDWCLLIWAEQTRTLLVQHCSYTVHLEWCSILSDYSMHGSHQTCDMMPINELWLNNHECKLTPSNKKTVESLQSADSFVSAFAKCVMNNISTSLSVLQVVSEIHTSPSDDKAVIMLIF